VRTPRAIDLSQPLDESTVLWPGSRPVRAETVSDLEADGYYTRALRLPEHSGTHLDAPAHFDPGGFGMDGISPDALVVACALLDVRDRCDADPDFALEAETIERLEDRDGRIEPGAAALIATGWDRHRDDAARYLGGRDEDELSFPGLAPSGAELLVERGVVGIGIDTLSVDPGRATDFPVHHVTLPAGLWHLEGLINLDALPARGALLVVGALPLVGGSGAPARVFALVPEADAESRRGAG